MKMIDVHISTGREFQLGEKNLVKCTHSAKFQIKGESFEEINESIAKARIWLESKNDDHLRLMSGKMEIDKNGS